MISSQRLNRIEGLLDLFGLHLVNSDLLDHLIHRLIRFIIWCTEFGVSSSWTPDLVARLDQLLVSVVDLHGTQIPPLSLMEGESIRILSLALIKYIKLILLLIPHHLCSIFVINHLMEGHVRLRWLIERILF